MKKVIIAIIVVVLMPSCTKRELKLEQNDLLIQINPGQNYLHKYELFFGISKMNAPQFVFWVEDLEENYITTLICTHRSATGTWIASKGEDKNHIHRESALPYWSHKRNIISEEMHDETDAHTGATTPAGYYMPTKNNPLIDAITCATPKEESEFKTTPIGNLRQFRIMAEFNQSTDFNESYPKSAIKGDANYNGGEHGSGQPSLVYYVNVDLTESTSECYLQLIGHGSPDGSTNELYTDLSNITSALTIVESIKITLK